MAKPQLVKVEALFYVLQHITYLAGKDIMTLSGQVAYEAAHKQQDGSLDW